MFLRNGLIVLCALIATEPTVNAQTSPRLQREIGPHQGTIHSVGTIQAETVIGKSGIRVFFYDAGGQPVDASNGRGVATASVETSTKRYRYSLLPADNHSLSCEMDLSHLAGRRVNTEFHIVGVRAGGVQRLTFRDVTTVAAPNAKVPPRKLTVQIVPATNADAKAIAKQAVCPVMDEPLGSMGHPIKLLVDEKPIFLCCKGCIKRVQANPTKYLRMVHGETQEKSVVASTESIRPGVYKVTAADTPFIAAQKICPVMEEPLDAMGGPFKVDAGGKAIYICCPGCAKRIIADPKKYVAMLAEQGVQAPTIRR